MYKSLLINTLFLFYSQPKYIIHTFLPASTAQCTTVAYHYFVYISPRAPPVAPVPSLGGKSASGSSQQKVFRKFALLKFCRDRFWNCLRKIKRRPLKVLIDSRSTGNFISDQVVASLHLKVVEDGIRQKFILPDKSIIWAGGWVDFLLTCVEYVRRISARVFPSLHKELILGMPWLVMEDPDISWRNRTVAVQQKGSFVQLPVLRPVGNIPQVDEINMCSAKQMSRWFWSAKWSGYLLGSSELCRDRSRKFRKICKLEDSTCGFRTTAHGVKRGIFFSFRHA